MDKKSKIFLSFFSLFTGVVIFFSFYKYVIKKDYYIEMRTACNPELENCFVYFCNPLEDAECPADSFDRMNFFKIVKKKAYRLINCNVNNLNCLNIDCEQGEDCTESLCSPEEHGEFVCITPEIFNNLKFQQILENNDAD